MHQRPASRTEQRHRVQSPRPRWASKRSSARPSPTTTRRCASSSQSGRLHGIRLGREGGTGIRAGDQQLPAVSLDPKNATAVAYLANAYEAKGAFDDAINFDSEAIRLDPQLTLAYRSRGWAREAKGDFEGAIADYNEAIRLDPNDAAAYTCRGKTYTEVRKTTTRRSQTTTKHRIDPDDQAATSAAAGS